MRIRIVAALALGAAVTAAAQTSSPTAEDLQKQIQTLQLQMQQMMNQYQGQIQQLQTQVDELKTQQVKASESAAPEGATTTGLLPPAPVAPPAANLANPAISLIPDFIASGGNDPTWKQNPALYVREVELALSANIDPYANAFAALSLENGSLNVEEAYATFPGLPGGWTMKLGQFKADFGKQNQMHTHVWLQADQPLVLRTFLGDEGLDDVGVSFTHLIPTPWMSDLTFQVFGGRNDVAFSGKRSDLEYLAAWRSFWDLTDASNLEAQISLTAGKNQTGHGTGLGDLSITYRYKPPGAKRESFLWRTEFLQDNTRTYESLNHAWGGFSYVDWQFTRGWFLGARADYAEHPLNPDLHDQGGALVVTFFPSEFQKFRLQWERTDYAGLGTRDAVVFEYGLSIGPHGAHPF